jgi:hypothetical protein
LLAGTATDDAARNKIIHADTLRPILRNGLARRPKQVCDASRAILRD